MNINEHLPKGNNQRKIYLPSDDFIYGKRNRTPTPIKNVINNDFGNFSEIEKKNEYKNIIIKVK